MKIFTSFWENFATLENSEKFVKIFTKDLLSKIRSAMAGSAAGVMLATSDEPYRYGWYTFRKILDRRKRDDIV